MKDINWVQVLVFALVMVVVFLLGIGVLFLFLGGGLGTMGRGMMGPGGMGWCPWCGGTGRFGGGLLGSILGLTLNCLLPLGVFVLLIFGGIWLVRNIGQGGPASSIVCPRCARPLEADWEHCPYCGEGVYRGPENE